MPRRIGELADPLELLGLIVSLLETFPANGSEAGSLPERVAAKISTKPRQTPRTSDRRDMMGPQFDGISPSNRSYRIEYANSLGSSHGVTYLERARRDANNTLAKNKGAEGE